MMYFTESEDAVEDPIQLNQEFEEEYDTAEYEKKISSLMRHAYNRIRKENPQGRQLWDEAIRTLHVGDHYILVFWDHKDRQKLISASFWKLLGISILVLIAAIIGFAVVLHYQDSKPFQPNATNSWPTWVRHLPLALIVGAYLSFLLFPRFWSWLSLKTIYSFRKTSHDDTSK